MSNFDESGVTYTDISSPFEELSYIGSPRADDHEHLELPEMLEDLYVEDDEDDDMDIKADEEEEEEHPAPADSVVVASTAADQAPSAEETEPFETDESVATPPSHPAYRMTSRISILAPVPVPAWSDSKVVRLLAMSCPPASPLSPWSSPLPRIPFPPLPLILSPPSPVLSPAPPPSSIRSLVYRAPMIRMRAEAASTSSPPLQPPSASRREDRPEVTLPPQKRLGIALGPRYEVGESSSAAAAKPAGGLRADYGFGAPVSIDTELGGYMREFETRVRQDTDEIYMRLDDEQTERQLLAGRLNMLFRDRRAHAYTRHLIETEARMSREAWVRSTDANDLVRGEVMSLRTTVLGQMTEIRELHAADRRRQTVISEFLRTDHRRSTKIIELRTALQGHVTALQGHKQMAPKRTTRSTADQETINATSVTNAQLQEMIDQGVTAALAARDALRSMNGDDSHNSRTGTEGVASLSQWFERMESVFHISNCAVENQVKFATCTLYSVALTWWNTHVKTVGHEAAYGIPWKTLMKMMAEKYCPRNEIKKLEMELWDLKPKTMQEAVEIATELMDKKIRTFAERETASKRKFENTSRNTQNQQQQSNKRQNTGQRGTGLGQKLTCYECGVQGHFKRECLKLKNNNNHGNQGGRNNAPARVYAVGHAGTDPDVKFVMGTFLLNNQYAYVLFDTSADKSFVSTKFSTQINIAPSTLDHCYDVELADGRIIRLNTILRDCTLNLLNHPFNIDLIPVELGSFDAIIGMDWLAKCQAVIACAEKIVHILLGNKTLIVHGDGSNQENVTRLSIISCTKTEKYVKKGFPVFLAHITMKEMWIEEECKYDIAAMYGISHWWFQRQRFYIDKHTSKGDRRAVRTHMRILSVVRIEVFSMYRYDYMKKIVLCRADLNKHVIAEQDFKYLYPSDFEDLYRMNLQGHLNHLPPKDKKIVTTSVNLWTRHLVIRQRVEDFQLGIERYQTQFNLTKPRWDATGFIYRHDYMIDKALDYRVKEFKINRMNPGLNTRFWTRKDVDRSKEFMFAIQKWLKTMRIFHNLENFVGGFVRDGDYRHLKRTE
nr:hypothetical protein [Tanacetum cinerariifolium]